MDNGKVAVSFAESPTLHSSVVVSAGDIFIIEVFGMASAGPSILAACLS